MTSPMYPKLFQSIEENLYNLGYSGKAKRKWFGDIAAGASTLVGNTVPVASCLMNFTDSSYPTTKDLAFIIVFRNDEVAGIAWPKAMTTQLHAYDQFAQAAGFLDLVVEQPPATILAADIAMIKFQADVLHILRGQFGSRVRLRMSAPASVPTIGGVDGKVQVDETAVTHTEIGVLLPYGRIAAAGELA